MMWFKRLLLCASLLPAPVWAEDLLIFAAASLKGPLDAIYADRPDVRIAYGGSGTLARQIQQGAPADLVLLANRAWMDALVESGHVAEALPIAGNRLALIGPAGAAPLALEADAIIGRLDGGRVAIGMTASVPAGIYAKEALQALGFWDALLPHLAEVDNVRSAAALVARGAAPLGIVYASDAKVVHGVQVVALLPADSHAPIAYWAAKVTDRAHPDVDAVLDRLQTPEAQMVLQDAGFGPP